MAPPGGHKPVPERRNPFIRPNSARGASPGRVAKNSDATKRTWSPSVFLNMPKDIPDPSKLHPGYSPRSPIQTRQKTAMDQQSVGTSGVSSSGGKTLPTSSNAIKTSNTYDVLNEDNGDDDDDKQNPADGMETEDEAKIKNKRQVPIVIPDYPGAAIDNLLSRAGCQYEILILKSSVLITYASRDKLPVKIVLTGYVPVTATQLAEVLDAYDVHPQEIRVLSSTETVTGEHVLYLLVFDRGSVKLQDLRRIKTLDGFVVSWRYFAKRPTDAAQCHRCQRFGHGSRNCTLPPKCVKCGEAHLTDQCSLPRRMNLGDNDNAEGNKALVKCVNCQGNHTANFRGCPARKSYLEVLEKQRKKPANKQPAKSSFSTVPRLTHPPGWGRTYASVTAAASDETPTTAAAAAAAAAAAGGADLFTLTEFLSLAREMFTRFRACQNKEQQFMALGELMIKYVGAG